MNIRIICTEVISWEIKFINCNFKQKIGNPDIERITFLPRGKKFTKTWFFLYKDCKKKQKPWTGNVELVLGEY